MTNLHKPLYINTLLLCLIALPCSALAEEPSFQKSIKANEFLCSGNVDFAQYDGQEYLVSVGQSAIVNDTPEAKLKARKEAKLNAEEGLMKFIYEVQVSSSEELKTKMQVTTQNGKTVKREFEESYLETIREQGEGILKHLISIGKWKSGDKKEYFYAVGYLVSHKQ